MSVCSDQPLISSFPGGVSEPAPQPTQQLYDECPGTPLRPNTMAQMKAMKTLKQGTDHGTQQMRTWCYAVCILYFWYYNDLF